MKLYRALSSGGETRSGSISLSELLTQLGGLNGLRPQMPPTLLGSKQEEIPPSFQGYVEHAYRENGIVFACMLVRMMLFSEARFQFRRIKNGRPGELFGTEALSLLEKPWAGATTGDLLSRCIQDADLAGNFFATTRGKGKNKRIVRLRPEWVTIMLGSYSEPKREIGAWDLDTEVIGYVYQPGGKGGEEKPRFLERDEVVHFAPIPDPLASFRGMSWLTPVIREIMGDKAATTHKLSYFENGASPNLVVSFDKDMNPDELKKWLDAFEENHQGAANAYRCLHPQTEVALWNGSRCPAGEVQAGDTVVAWSDGKAVPGVVSAAEWQPASPVITITTQRGRVIKTNAPHPFLTPSGWVEAQDLKEGDLLTTGLGWGRPRMQDSITADEAWMIGLLVGDGCFVPGTPTVTMANEGIRARMGSVADVRKLPVRDRAPYDYAVRGIAPLVRSLGLNGKRAYEKRVPAAVMTGGVEVVSAFISGLVDADGHVSDPEQRQSCEVNITSTSKGLLEDVQHLLASLGVNASVSSPRSMRAGVEGGGSGVVRRHDAHRLTVGGNVQAASLDRLLSLGHEEKARRLATYATSPSKQDRSRVDRVVSVVVSAPEPTIGIEVADHHTHVTGGVVTHNTLILASGASADKIGSDMKEVDFKKVQAAGENRIAVASGVSGIIVGLSEGMEAATLANYGQARRRDADVTLRPLWRNMAGSFSKIVDVPGGAELWFDDRDISFLQEDLKDEAEIQHKQAVTIRQYVDAGYTPESAVEAVESGDLSRLVHTGLFSVQLQPPGTANPGAPGQYPALPSGE